MRQAIRETLDELETPNPPLAADTKAYEVLCICARPDGDDIPAQMLTQLLRTAGCRTEVWQPDAITASAPVTQALERANVIWISAMPPGAEAAARELTKRLQARDRSKVFVGLWTGPQSNRSRDQILRAGAAGVLFTMTDAVEETLEVCKGKNDKAPSPAATPDAITIPPRSEALAESPER